MSQKKRGKITSHLPLITAPQKRSSRVPDSPRVGDFALIALEIGRSCGRSPRQTFPAMYALTWKLFLSLSLILVLSLGIAGARETVGEKSREFLRIGTLNYVEETMLFTPVQLRHGRIRLVH